MAPALQKVERERFRRLVVDELDRISARKPRQKVLERALMLAHREDLPATHEGWVDFIRGPLDEATRAILGSPAAAILAEALRPAIASMESSVSRSESGGRMRTDLSGRSPVSMRRPVSGARKLGLGSESPKPPDSRGPQRVGRPRHRKLETLSYKQGGLETSDAASRVLVVDDEPSYRSALARMLASRGYEVSTAPDRKTALWMCERLHPRLVLSDYELCDGGTGLDLAQSLRAKLGHKAPPVLLVTASTALPRASERLVVKVLAKNLTDDLMEAVAEIVGRPEPSTSAD